MAIERVREFKVPSELEMKMSRLDIRCDYLMTMPGPLPRATKDSLIEQVREVITEFYSELREKENQK